mgnify:CR=1 FL=1
MERIYKIKPLHIGGVFFMPYFYEFYKLFIKLRIEILNQVSR